MCGIVGYIGRNQALPILIEGLKRLEYRGYDSAGLAFLQGKEFAVIRAEGKLENLVNKISESGQNFTSSLGIGHTRWATHGKPSEVNAHPHQSQDFVLVHNGIIENHLNIKKQLLAKGHKFCSETDTEVVCHLMQEHFDSGLNAFAAIQKTLTELQGAFSLVILHRGTPDKFFAVKKGSPLVVGFRNDAALVASDVPALLQQTRDVVFLEDEEIAVLSLDGVDFFNFAGQQIQKPITKIHWTLAQAEKGGYKHFMLKEIMEQPRAIADSLMGRLEDDQLHVTLTEVDALCDELLQRPNFKMQIVACGTSYHAGLVGKYWIEGLARLPVSVELASEYRYREPLVDQDTLVIAISQSGETADTLAAVEMSLKANAKVLSICNAIESSIPRKATRTLYTHAGPEIGVASTKAFTTQMVLLYLLALKLAEKQKSISATAYAERVTAFLELPAKIESFLKVANGKISEMADVIRRSDHCYFLGRGIQYPIVMEGALKLKEISYIHAEGFAGGEMKHGPIALIEENIPVVGLVLKDGVYDKNLSNLIEVEARGAQVFALISEGDVDLKKKFVYHLEVPNTHVDLQPFLTVLPLQLLAYHVADRKGTDVDQPRNLAKSVTVE